ncbi:MAG: zf-HC2 domain-containing protein [Bacteroidota bacterium]
MSVSALLVMSFGLGICWLVWRNMREGMRHLDEQDIEDFLAGRLDERNLKRVREHLLVCEECRALLDEMSKKSQKHKPDRLLKRRF